MILEKWVCNVCGSPCRVEIEFDGKGPAGDVDRFRKTCICVDCFYIKKKGTEWRLVYKGEVENAPTMEEKFFICQHYAEGADCAWHGDSIQCSDFPCVIEYEGRKNNK
jgi:hypothetical protein